MRRTLTKRVLTLFLAIALLYTWVFSFPVSSRAEDTGFNDEPKIEAKDPEQLQKELDELTFEVEELREENIKHFHLPDGTYQAVIYGNPVHRMDSDGNWVDIDNTLKDDGTDLTTSDARIKFAKKITGNENLFTLREDKYKITFGLENATKKTKGVFTNTESSKDKTATKLQKLIDLDNITASVVYEDILYGVDLEYVLIANSIKENIIVKETSDRYCYTFSLELNGLAAFLENNAIYLYDTETEGIIYEIPQPYMYDAVGEVSTEVTYSLIDEQNGKYSLILAADETWLNSEDRTFPVIIDPILLDVGQNADTYVYSAAPNTNYGSSQYLWVLDSAEAYYKFATPTLPKDATVTNALLEIPFYYSVVNQKYLTMGAYQISSNWNEHTVTWSSRPGTNSTLLGSSNLYANGASSTDPEYGVFNVTSYVKGWYSGTPNYGFALKRVGGTNTSVLLVAREKIQVYAKLSVYYSGSNLADGIYAIQKKSTQTYVKSTRTTYSGTVTQETHTSTPTSSSDLDNLFKISYRPQYDDYVIRSMVDNALLIYPIASDCSVGVTSTTVSDASLITWYTWKIVPSDGCYYITYTTGGNTYYLRSSSTSSGAQLSLTTNSTDSGTLWFFNKYNGITLEKIQKANIPSALTVGDTYSCKAYMYSTRINHNGPVTYSVTDTDNTATDKATVGQTTGYFRALKNGEVRLNVTYPGAPYVWYWNITINLMPCSGSEIAYNPSLWNSESIMPNSNCYNYALNICCSVPGSDYYFLQPGVATKQKPFRLTQNGTYNNLPLFYSQLLSGAEIEELAILDADEFGITFEAIGKNDTCPYGTYKVALVIDSYDDPAYENYIKLENGTIYIEIPDTDYHWYRQNPDGTWSHKRGDSYATNLDASENIIYDPQICDRNYGDGLNYSIFVGYYAVSPIDS